jgi:hypothetical protein
MASGTCSSIAVGEYGEYMASGTCSSIAVGEYGEYMASGTCSSVSVGEYIASVFDVQAEVGVWPTGCVDGPVAVTYGADRACWLEEIFKRSTTFNRLAAF